MKIRLGFVANSSSSSFCVFGAAIDDSVMIEAMVKAGCLTQQEADDENVYVSELLENEKVEKLFTELGLTFTCDYDNNVTYIGREFTSIGDDETGKEFKTSIKKSLKKVFGDVEVETHEGEINC